MAECSLPAGSSSPGTETNTSMAAFLVWTTTVETERDNRYHHYVPHGISRGGRELLPWWPVSFWHALSDVTVKIISNFFSAIANSQASPSGKGSGIASQLRCPWVSCLAYTPAPEQPVSTMKIVWDTLCAMTFPMAPMLLHRQINPFLKVAMFTGLDLSC